MKKVRLRCPALRLLAGVRFVRVASQAAAVLAYGPFCCALVVMSNLDAERRQPSTFFRKMRAARREADEAETSGATQACPKARRGETGATTKSWRSGWSAERVEMPWEDSCCRPDKELSAEQALGSLHYVHRISAGAVSSPPKHFLPPLRRQDGSVQRLSSPASRYYPTISYL